MLNNIPFTMLCTVLVYFTVLVYSACPGFIYSVCIEFIRVPIERHVESNEIQATPSLAEHQIQATPRLAEHGDLVRGGRRTTVSRVSTAGVLCLPQRAMQWRAAPPPLLGRASACATRSSASHIAFAWRCLPSFPHTHPALARSCA